MADSRRGETAGWGLRGFTTWYEGVAEKATRRESPLISVPHYHRAGTSYKWLIFSNLTGDLGADPRLGASFWPFNLHRMDSSKRP